MSIETEVKIKIAAAGDFCARLESLGAERLSERELEDNLLLDFPDESLRQSRCVLRVRSVGGRGLLTYKGAPRPETIFKSREELETEIASPSAALAIFERLGMRLSFRYQKYRQEFMLDGVCVAVDETPAGNYAELEGAEEAILRLARRLELSESLFIRKSYHALHLDYCREKGVELPFMLFEPGQ